MLIRACPVKAGAALAGGPTTLGDFGASSPTSPGVGGMPITASASRSRGLAGGNDKMGGAEILFDKMSCAPSEAYPNCHGEASTSPTICIAYPRFRETSCENTRAAWQLFFTART